MAHFTLLLLNIFILMQFYYAAVNSFTMGQSDSMNVEEPVRASVASPAQMTLYISGPGRVRVLLPIDIIVMPLRQYREQLAMTTSIPAQNNIYMNGRANPSGIQYPTSDTYRWPAPVAPSVVRPFPILPPEYRPQSEPLSPLDPFSRKVPINNVSPYYNVNIPSRVVPGKPWIPPTQRPINTTTLESTTTSSKITVASTTVAALTTTEIPTTTAPPTTTTTTPTTTSAASLESIVLDEPHKTLPDTAEIINENDKLPHVDSEPINALNAPLITTQSAVVDDKFMQQEPTVADIVEIGQAPTEEPMNLPSAFPVDDIQNTEAPAHVAEN